MGCHKKWTFWPSKTEFLVNFVTKSGPFGHLGDLLHLPPLHTHRAPLMNLGRRCKPRHLLMDEKTLRPFFIGAMKLKPKSSTPAWPVKGPLGLTAHQVTRVEI